METYEYKPCKNGDAIKCPKCHPSNYSEVEAKDFIVAGCRKCGECMAEFLILLSSDYQTYYFREKKIEHHKISAVYSPQLFSDESLSELRSSTRYNTPFEDGYYVVVVIEEEAFNRLNKEMFISGCTDTTKYMCGNPREINHIESISKVSLADCCFDYIRIMLEKE